VTDDLADHEGERVCQREATELIWVEAAAVVTTHYATHHDQDASGISLFDEAAQRLSPSRESPPLFEVEADRLAHRSSRGHDIIRDPRGADDLEWCLAHRSRVVAVPLLTLLAEVNGVEQVRVGWPICVLPIVQKSGIGTLSTGGASRNRKPTGVKLALAKSSSCFSVGCAERRSQATTFGKRRPSVVLLSPARSRAQRSSSRLTSTRFMSSSS